MKRIVKVIVGIQVILLCGFLTGLYSIGNTLSATTPSQNNENIPLNEKSFFTSASLFSTLTSENQVSGLNLVPAPSLKNHTDDSRAHHRTVELRLINLSANYIIYSGNIDPGFPKTVITFPFHYFW